MKRIYFFILLIVSFGCENMINSKSNKNEYDFFVGTYTNGGSEGIYSFSLLKTGEIKENGLIAKSDNPSYLALSNDSKFLLAVNEVNRNDRGGLIESYSITKDSLILISRKPSGGAHPCHVSISKANEVLVANYTGGNIGFLKLNEVGELTDLLDLKQHTGKGKTDRQEAPHAHSAWFKPNTNEVIAVDLGTNELWFYAIDSNHQKLYPQKQEKLAMADGAGPRHLTFHPNGAWIYVVNELDCTISLIIKNKKNEYEIKETISTVPEDFNEENTCADIHVSKNGRFVYASNRGHNSIAIFRINSQNGFLELIGHESTGGEGPRNFAISPDGEYLLVANQKTDNMVSFKINGETGFLSFIDQTEVFSPVCILF